MIAGPARPADQDLADECRSLAASDAAGRRWSAKHYLGGYTSYGSLDRLHLVSSLFAACGGASTRTPRPLPAHCITILPAARSP